MWKKHLHNGQSKRNLVYMLSKLFLIVGSRNIILESNILIFYILYNIMCLYINYHLTCSTETRSVYDMYLKNKTKKLSRHWFTSLHINHISISFFTVNILNVYWVNFISKLFQLKPLELSFSRMYILILVYKWHIFFYFGEINNSFMISQNSQFSLS